MASNITESILLCKVRGYNYNRYGVYSEIRSISSCAIPRESNRVRVGEITYTEITVSLILAALPQPEAYGELKRHMNHQWRNMNC